MRSELLQQAAFAETSSDIEVAVCPPSRYMLASLPETDMPHRREIRLISFQSKDLKKLPFDPA